MASKEISGLICWFIYWWDSLYQCDQTMIANVNKNLPGYKYQSSSVV